jgi:glutamate 5-kinase
MKTDRELAIIKFGSTSSTHERGMHAGRLRHYAAQIALQRQRYNRDIIVVASGAVMTGRALWQQQFGAGAEQLDDQEAAMMGSAASFMAWQRALRREGIMGAQLLLTHREIDDEKHAGRILRDALAKNIRRGTVTVVNENDAVSLRELRKLSYGGDNDGLASHIGVAMGAAHLCLMTDKEGLLDHQKKVIDFVDDDNRDATYAYATNSGRGGGMVTKYEAAETFARSGGEAHIAHATKHDWRAVLANQAGSGTHFAAYMAASAKVLQ